MRRIPSLDGLRAISISIVVVGHRTSLRYRWEVGAVCQFRSEDFFVISGYLITTWLLQEQARSSTIQPREFYVRRAYRILPAAIALMLAVFIIYWGQLQFYFLWPGVLKKWHRHLTAILVGVILLAPIYRFACHLLNLHGRERDFSGGGRRPGDRLPAGDFRRAPAAY